MMTLQRMVMALMIFVSLLVVSGGCAVIHTSTRGTETETKLSTKTTGYLLFYPLWRSETIITKEKGDK